jgi:hypothetical protein
MTYRNRKLLDAVRELPCQVCGVQDGTVCAAHRNEGKGMGIKVSDALVAALCHRCHSALDQGAVMTREERRDCWNNAAIKTYQALIERGIVRVA